MDFFKALTGKTKEELIRSEIFALRARGNVTWAEWDVPMNSYERDELLPALTDEAFLRHFVYCATQVGHSGPGSYNYAVSSKLAPEAMRRGIGVAREAYLESTVPKNPDAASRAEFLALYLRGMLRLAPVGEDSGSGNWGDLSVELKAKWSRYAASVLSFTDRMAAERWGDCPPWSTDEAAVVEMVERARVETWKGWFSGTIEVNERGWVRHMDVASAYPVAAFARAKGERVDGRGVPLDAEGKPKVPAGQEHCPECLGEGGFDPDEIPNAPVVCFECQGTGLVTVEAAAAWRKKNAEGFAAVVASLCPGCGALNGLLDDGTCRECPWTRAGV